MFGNFAENFGLNFPLQGADVQGGMFGQNAPAPETGGASQGGLPAPTPPPAAAPAAGMAAPSAAPQSSPLASPLGPGQQQQPQPSLPDQAAAPAVGVGSPLGKPML
jgi:hypothetical protein